MVTSSIAQFRRNMRCFTPSSWKQRPWRPWKWKNILKFWVCWNIIELVCILMEWWLVRVDVVVLRLGRATSRSERSRVESRTLGLLHRFLQRVPTWSLLLQKVTVSFFGSTSSSGAVRLRCSCHKTRKKEM